MGILYLCGAGRGASCCWVGYWWCCLVSVGETLELPLLLPCIGPLLHLPHYSVTGGVLLPSPGRVLAVLLPSLFVAGGPECGGAASLFLSG